MIWGGRKGGVAEVSEAVDEREGGGGGEIGGRHEAANSGVLFVALALTPVEERGGPSVEGGWGDGLVLSVVVSEGGEKGDVVDEDVEI